LSNHQSGQQTGAQGGDPTGKGGANQDANKPALAEVRRAIKNADQANQVEDQALAHSIGGQGCTDSLGRAMVIAILFLILLAGFAMVFTYTQTGDYNILRYVNL